MSRLITNINADLGAIQFSDNQYTSVSPFTSVSNTIFQLPNNKGVILNNSAPELATDWIDNTGKITPDNGNGDSYMARINFVVVPKLFKGLFYLKNSFLDVRLNIGGSQGNIWGDDSRKALNVAEENFISLVIPFYAGSTFFANGGILNITTTSNCEFYDISYIIQKTAKVY